MLSRALLIGFIVGTAFGILPGFALGVYFLPIIVAEDGADSAQITQAKSQSLATAVFRRDLAGSDLLHWGEGRLFLSRENLQYFFTLEDEISPGPDYKLYLTPKFVEDEAGFEAIKNNSIRVADVAGHENIRIAVPTSIDPTAYAAVVIWCERFSEFITAGRLTVQ